MPYNPSEHFDAGMIYRGITGAGDSIAAGIQDMEKKRREAEAQDAGATIQFQTLKQAGLLSPEEQANFHSGNANKRAAIVTSATPRLMEKLKTDAETSQNQQHQLNRDLQLQIAQMHYGPDSGDGSNAMFTPDPDTAKAMKDAGYVFARTSRGSGRWMNVQPNKPDVDADGNPIFSPDGTAFISGGKVRPLTDTMIQQRQAYMDKVEKAKKAVGPHWYDNFIPDALKSSPSAPQAASGAAPVAPPMPAVVPTTSIIAKNGHHYEVDHATKSVLRQID